MMDDRKDGDEDGGGAPMLEYRARAADRSAISAAQIVGGFVVGMLVVGGGVLAGAFARAGVHAGSNLLLICFLCSALVVNLLAAVNYSRPDGRGYGIGLWIGFGVASAGFGGCLGLGR